MSPRAAWLPGGRFLLLVCLDSRAVLFVGPPGSPQAAFSNRQSGLLGPSMLVGPLGLFALYCLFQTAWSSRPVLSARVARLPGGLILLLARLDTRAVSSSCAAWLLRKLLSPPGRLVFEGTLVS